MKTYTDAERYQAIRKLAVMTNNDPDRAERITQRMDEITEQMDADIEHIDTDAAFDKISDALCELMQTEN